MRQIALWLALGGLVGCKGATVKTDAAPSRAGAAVALEIGLAGGEGTPARALVVDGDVVSGAEFTVKVRSAQDAYVYVGQRSLPGSLSLIAPQPKEPLAQVQAGQVVVLPAAGRWFKLDEQPGREAIVVLLSGRALGPDAATQRLAEQSEAVCQTTRDPPPPDPKVRERGRDKVEGKLGEDGTAVLCFPFRHVARP